MSVADALGLNRDEIVTLGRNAYLASFMDPDDKTQGPQSVR